MEEQQKISILLEKLTTLTKPHFAEGQEEVDITAVEKYIISEGYCGCNYSKNIKEYSLKDNEDFEIEFTILNKPLTLYTLEELEELYKLIKELGNT